MYISLDWLKQHVVLPKDLDPKELGLKLTLATVEVEGWEDLGLMLDKVIVGQVEKVESHPNADKLKLVKVNIGNKDLIKVVCGGVNLKEKMLVALALPGAKVRWHGEGNLIELEKTQIRGEESYGMICASDEIGLGELFPCEEGAILDLSFEQLQLGQSLSEALGLDDIVYEIDNKSLTNRPDLWGHYGLAREVAAIYGNKLNEYNLNKIKNSKEIDLTVQVKEKELCPRYLAVALEGVRVGSSPDWLKKYLRSIGQKSINNIVDITNYVMYELGQPLHAFSADKITDNLILVRKAKPAEKLVTLDGEERELNEDDLVIADKEKAIALAGVMGNANSEIIDSTKTVIIESANFDPVSIRKTANRLNLRTEAAIRFEKGLDPNNAEIALKKAVNLMQDLIPGAKVVSEIVDVSNFKLNQGPIELTWNFINKRIGFEVNKKQVVKTLESLGFEVKEVKEKLSLKIPTWRATKDVSIKEDIIEEISRIYGYDNIEPVMPEIKMDVPEENKLRKLERKIKNICSVGLDANEVYNYSFADQKFLHQINQGIVDFVELENPWTPKQSYLRQNLIPGLLKNVVDNLRFYSDLNIFEIGKVFIDNYQGVLCRNEGKERLPEQPLICAGVLVSEKDKEASFVEGKKFINFLFDQLGVKFNYEVSGSELVWQHPKQTLNIMVDKEKVGYLTNLHPQLTQNLDLNKTVTLWQIDLTKLIQYYPTQVKYQEPAKFPAIELDLSILVNEEVQWKDIKNIVQSVSPQLIKQVDLFDVYKSGKIKVGKKSIAFTIKYQSDDRTLEMNEVEGLQKKIIEQLEKGLKAEVRK